MKVSEKMLVEPFTSIYTLPYIHCHFPFELLPNSKCFNDQTALLLLLLYFCYYHHHLLPTVIIKTMNIIILSSSSGSSSSSCGSGIAIIITLSTKPLNLDYSKILAFDTFYI